MCVCVCLLLCVFFMITLKKCVIKPTDKTSQTEYHIDYRSISCRLDEIMDLGYFQWTIFNSRARNIYNRIYVDIRLYLPILDSRLCVFYLFKLTKIRLSLYFHVY